MTTSDFNAAMKRILENGVNTPEFNTVVARIAHQALMAHYTLAAKHAADAHAFAAQLFTNRLYPHAIKMQIIAAKAYEAKVQAHKMILLNKEKDT